MNRLNTVTKIIIVAITGAILIILFIIYGGTSGSNQSVELPTTASPANVPTTSTGNPTETSTPMQPSGGSPTSASPSHTYPATPATKSLPSPIISIITPVANDIWKIGMQNLISWNKVGDISGSVSLISAVTQQFVGVILPQVGPNQTSYTWDARDVLLNRTNPYKKDVLPGAYEIQLSYDGNSIQPAKSSVFTITN